jgi:hypothetical protein
MQRKPLLVGKTRPGDAEHYGRDGKWGRWRLGKLQECSCRERHARFLALLQQIPKSLYYSVIVK